MQRSHPLAERPAQYDAEVLIAIRDALRSAYEDVLKQPMPRKVRAVLARLEDESLGEQPALTRGPLSEC